MGGISGSISVDRSVRTIEFVKAHQAIAHRGTEYNKLYYFAPEGDINCTLTFDSQLNLWNQQLNDLPNGRIILGQHCQSYQDASFYGYEVLQHEHWTLLLDGEIYNKTELRNELLKLGYNLKTLTDAEALLMAWAEWGEKALSKINGVWAFCIYDQVNDRLYLSRDRFGEKPLYWTIYKQTLLFASELKFFKRLVPLRLNDARAHDYLVKCQIDHSNETLFSGVFQVIPGTVLTFDTVNLSRREFRYWNLSDCSLDKDRSYGDSCYEFLQLLDSAIRIRSDIPIGILLSGGLDSSAIAGFLNDNDSISKIHSYSAVFTDKRFSEQENIELVLQRNRKLENNFISYGPEEALEQLPDMLWTQDHPIRSLAPFSQYKLHQFIHSDSHAGVVLSGTGADGLFGGFSMYNHLYLVSLLIKGQYYRFVSETYSLLQLNGMPASSISIDVIRTIYALVRDKNIANVAAEGLCFWQRKGLFGSALPEYLRYEDRNSMAVSTTSRFPFLDYRLAEFAMTIPDSFKVQNGVRKRLMRTALVDVVPQEILADRVKKGFISPQLMWQQTEPMNNWINNNFDIPSFAVQSRKKSNPWYRWRVACFNQWRSIFEV